MSREAFEAWQKSIGRHPSQEKDRIARGYLLSIDHRIYAAWQAAQSDAFERAAKVCEHQADEPECPERAFYCADAIRALKETE